MAAPLYRFDHSRPTFLVGRRSALAVAALDSGASMHQNGALLCAVWGQARFLDSHLNDLAKHQGIAKTFAEHCPSWDEKGLRLLSGAFSIALLNERDGEALLAVDRMGICPLIYQLAGDCLVFGSTAEAINLHPCISPEIDRQGIYNYVYFHMVPGPGTIYRGQRRLLPGEHAVFRNGKLETGIYWKMEFEERKKRAFPELQQEFLTVLRTSVAEAAGNQEVGAFLSGGTDSSTVAGILGDVTGKPARTYSIGFGVAGYDEMEYARIAARHFATQHHEYYVTPDDVAGAIPKIAAGYDQPFGNSSAVPAYYCAKLARSDGVETLLGGDGGDELFGGNARYAKQYLFSLYERLPATLRKGVLEPLAFCFPGGEKISFLRKARSYIEKARTPMPERLESYNQLGSFGHQRVFSPDFLDGIDTTQPLRLLNEVYHSARAKTLINRMLALDLKFTLADNDLPKVQKTCELAGVDVAFPMLDERVVAFSARLEPCLKLKATKLRYFFKEALRGFLPDEIIAKKKHGFGLPFGPWLQSHRGLQDIVNDSLNDLKKRDIIRSEFIDELVSVRVADHPGYYGTMVWVLMMLEQWFQHHNVRL